MKRKIRKILNNSAILNQQLDGMETQYNTIKPNFILKAVNFWILQLIN